MSWLLRINQKGFFAAFLNIWIHGFIISVPVLVLPIFRQLLLRNRKISCKSLFWIERTLSANNRWQQQSYFKGFLNNFDITHFNIGIILRFNCYQQPNQLLLNNKENEFSTGTVWPLQVARFATGCCWKNIHLEPVDSRTLKAGTRLFGTSL